MGGWYTVWLAVSKRHRSAVPGAAQVCSREGGRHHLEIPKYALSLFWRSLPVCVIWILLNVQLLMACQLEQAQAARELAST